MTKAIYYSKKMKKYYFSNITVFGDYFAETVYGCENLEPGSIEIKKDKNGEYINETGAWCFEYGERNKK